jgi:cell division protein FtsL
LLDIREEEVDKLKAEVSKLNEQNEELKTQVEQIERENRVLKTTNRVVPVQKMINNNSDNTVATSNILSTAALLEELQ